MGGACLGDCAWCCCGGVLCFIALTQSLLSPQLVAEVAHPMGINAGTAGGVLTFFYHGVLVIMLSLPATVLNR